jgi:S1-C subfamily serine protease
MDLTNAYLKVKGSVVAFVPVFLPRSGAGAEPPPIFPIVGTGFVVHPDGLIATNAHVISVLGKLPRPPGTPRGVWPARALLLKLAPEGVLMIGLEIAGVFDIDAGLLDGPHYGHEHPDIGLVLVKTTELPAVELDDATIIEEGREVATAGYPMGTQALLASGEIDHMSPTLQRGIVSAVLPMAGVRPNAYKINVMVQGGASGSPVFLSDSGKVIGIAKASLLDPVQTPEGSTTVLLPTNISYAVPARFLATALELLRTKHQMFPHPDAKPLSQVIAGAKLVNIFEAPPRRVITSWPGDDNTTEGGRESGT